MSTPHPRQEISADQLASLSVAGVMKAVRDGPESLLHCLERLAQANAAGNRFNHSEVVIFALFTVDVVATETLAVHQETFRIAIRRCGFELFKTLLGNPPDWDLEFEMWDNLLTTRFHEYTEALNRVPSGSPGPLWDLGKVAHRHILPGGALDMEVLMYLSVFFTTQTNRQADSLVHYRLVE